jgi:hypothetical protein
MDHFKRGLVAATFDQLTKSQHEVLGYIPHHRAAGQGKWGGALSRWWAFRSDSIEHIPTDAGLVKPLMHFFPQPRDVWIEPTPDKRNSNAN